MTVLNLKEAAEVLKMHPESLRRLASTGVVPCKRIGRGSKPGYRFLKEKLIEWLSEDLPFQDPRIIKHRVHRKEVTL